MYENNSNETEIYFTPEYTSHKPTFPTNIHSGKMNGPLKPKKPKIDTKKDDIDRTHGRCDSWYNLDAGLETDDDVPIALPTLKNGPDGGNLMKPLGEDEPKRKSINLKSKIVCIAICLCIVLGASVPVGIFFGPKLINIISAAINGKDKNGYTTDFYQTIS